MTVKEALRLLKDGDLYDDKGYLSAKGYQALEMLEDVELIVNTSKSNSV